MKGKIWNGRGLRDLAKHSHIADCVKDHELDFVAITDFVADFLKELVNLAKDNPYPILIGGDFNILRYRQEKNNDRFDNYWPFLFNAVIDSLNLREVSMSGATIHLG